MVAKHGQVLLNFKEKPISPTSSIPFIVPIYEIEIHCHAMEIFGYQMEQYLKVI
jgi:hypothetical protein